MGQQFDLLRVVQSWPIPTWPVPGWHIPTWPVLDCYVLTRHVLTWPVFTLPTLAWPSIHSSDTFQTPSRNLTEPSRYLPDTFIKTPSRHPPDILYIPLRPLDTRTLTYGHLYTFQVRRCGWVDFPPIIKPLRGPTCMLKTSKISTQAEIASWARVWQQPWELSEPEGNYRKLWVL